MELMGSVNYHEIPVSRICINASLPRRTFYYYFDSKEDVLVAVIDRLLRECELESMFWADTEIKSMEQGFTRFFQYWSGPARRELCILERNGLEQMLMTRSLKWGNSEDRWHRLIENYTAQKQEIGSMLGIACVFYTLFHWCRHGFFQSPEQMAVYVTQLLTNPIYQVQS